VKQLIVTADDFGLSKFVNEAVEFGHTRGILTAASLMASGPAFGDALGRARRLPTLGVGLHLTLVNGRPILPPAQIPGLVGRDGRFFDDPVKVGVKLYFSRDLQRQAEAEISAQFNRFRESGLVMDHVNGHLHFHMHPVVARILTQLTPAFGSPPIRIPLEPALFLAMAEHRWMRLSTWLFRLLMTRPLRGRATAAGSAINDHVFGLCDSGAMNEARVLALLQHMPEGVSEFYFHPATERWSGPDNLPASYQPEAEFAALTSSAVRAKVAEIGAKLIPFRGLTKD
jgi:chitin disaccharide deacetylase